MKKIYLKPEIETIEVQFCTAVMAGSDPLNNDPGVSTVVPVVPAPKRRTPAF